MKMWNVGVVGCGGIAIERHLPAWRKIREVRVVAVVDINEKRVKEVAKKFSIQRYYTDFSEMLASEKYLDIVDICTPIKFHGEYAIKALKNGKHTIVEKPMAYTIDECKEMIRFAQKNNVKLTVCHTFRCYPAVRKVKELIEKGLLGGSLSFHYIMPYWELQPWVSESGGPLWEVGVHAIYLALYLMGDAKKVEVYVQNDTQSNIEIVLHTERGLSKLHLLKAKGMEEIFIFGDKGKAVLPYLPFNIAFIDKATYKGFVDIFKTNVITHLKMASTLVKRGVEYTIKGVTVMPHYTILRGFIDAVEGKGEVPIPPSEGKRTIEILKEIEKQITRY